MTTWESEKNPKDYSLIYYYYCPTSKVELYMCTHAPMCASALPHVQVLLHGGVGVEVRGKPVDVLSSTMGDLGLNSGPLAWQ